MTRLLFGFILATSLIAAECDFDLGDLNQYVVSYDVRVTNSSPVSAAVVTVRMKGVARSATLFKGKSLAVTGFSGGDYAVTVGHLGLRLVQLKGHRDVLKVLIDTADSPGNVAALQAQLKAMMEAIATIESGVGGATCKGKVRPGKSVTIVLSEQAGQWHC
jgi:hypothetical protein